MTTRQSQLSWILSTVAIVLVADQVTKAIVMATIDVYPVFREGVFFQFTHQRNEGLIGGVMSGQKLVTFLAPSIATVVLICLLPTLEAKSKLQSVAYGMVLAGAAGNLIDRIRLGSVTDFLQFNFYFIPFDFPWKRYPAFNIADSGVVVGVIVLIIAWNTTQKKEPDVPSTV